MSNIISIGIRYGTRNASYLIVNIFMVGKLENEVTIGLVICNSWISVTFSIGPTDMNNQY